MKTKNQNPALNFSRFSHDIEMEWDRKPSGQNKNCNTKRRFEK